MEEEHEESRLQGITAQESEAIIALQQITQLADSEDVLQRTLHILQSAHPTIDNVAVYLTRENKVDAERFSSEYTSTAIVPGQGITYPMAAPRAEPPAGERVITDLADVESNRYGALQTQRALRLGARAVIVAPLQIRHRLVGSLVIRSNLPNQFSEEMLPFFRQVASALAVYCENQLVLHKARMDARLEGVSLEQARIAAQLESEGISPLLELREYIEESAGKVAQGYSASRAVRELTGEGAQAIDQAIQGVRRLVATDDMTAPQLSEELEKVVLATESQAGVPILWGAFGQPADLPGYLRHAICDTVGEMLNYLCTQGQPRQLRVLLDANSERLKVEVEEIGARAAHDSGARRPSAARRPQHLQALARQFGGQIDYASSAQWGTRLTLRVPLVEVGEWRQGTDSAPAATAISPEHLSPREAEILTLISQGLTNDGISRDLSIKLGTVRWHVSNILAKLDARNRTDAVRIARERHLIQE